MTIVIIAVEVMVRANSIFQAVEKQSLKLNDFLNVAKQLFNVVWRDVSFVLQWLQVTLD